MKEVLLALGLMLAVPPIAEAADQSRIIVTGEGESTVAPDLAILTLGVMREGDTAAEALDAENKAMAEVIADMKAAGIAARDLRTAGLSIDPRYSQSKPDQPDSEPKIIGYRATNTLSVQVHDVSKVGDVIDRAVKLGVNQGGGIAFTNENPAAAKAEARRKAVLDAMANARTLAEAAGARLGKVLEISEQNYAPPRPMLTKSFAARDSVPVEPGMNSYTATVTITFELGQ